MIEFFRKLFGSNESKPIDDEHLTNREIRALHASKCPDCGSKELLCGPSGGMSTNVACAHCGAEFNVCGVALNMTHRNSPKGKPNVERLRSIFGIELPVTT